MNGRIHSGGIRGFRLELKAAQAVLKTPQRAIVAALTIKTVELEHGDDRFRHCLSECEKRVEDAGLSRKRSPQNISANAKRTDFALAA